MKNMFKDVDKVSIEAQKSWEAEGKETTDEYFKSFELGWFRAAYMELYQGMNRVLKSLDEKNAEISELNERIEKYIQELENN